MVTDKFGCVVSRYLGGWSLNRFWWRWYVDFYYSCMLFKYATMLYFSQCIFQSVNQLVNCKKLWLINPIHSMRIVLLRIRIYFSRLWMEYSRIYQTTYIHTSYVFPCKCILYSLPLSYTHTAHAPPTPGYDIYSNTKLRSSIHPLEYSNT